MRISKKTAYEWMALTSLLAALYLSFRGKDSEAIFTGIVCLYWKLSSMQSKSE